MVTLRLLATALAVLVLAGCSSSPHRPSQTAAGLATARRTHEYPTPIPAQHAGPGFAAPEIAIERFASGYINWTAATVAAHMRALAKLSIGQARSAVTLTAAETASDYELRRGGIANRGTVEAVAPIQDQRNQYAVVTRERTTASNTSAYQGLAPAWHVAVATVARLSTGGWVISAWQPEN